MNEILDNNTQKLDATEKSLRPATFDEYIGQNTIKNKMQVFINAAKNRGECLDHILFYGPSGLGKTTLAIIIANEMEANIHSTSAPAIEKTWNLVSILTNLEKHNILFIDEIHRLQRKIEEVLYSAIEDYQIDVISGKKGRAKAIKIPLPKFTLIGATTRIGMISSPLCSRFGIIERLDFYEEEDLQTILKLSSKKLNIEYELDGLMEIAKCSRGTPRIANRLLKRVRDYAQENNHGVINKDMAIAALKFLEIDNDGLDKMDRMILEIIIKNYDGGPVGLETIAASINEMPDTIEEFNEPFLIRKGFIERTKQGRCATDKAYECFGLKPPLVIKE